MTGYDLIGDIHGHAQPLRLLLQMLGYRDQGGCYRHPTRQAIFLGDFIDRGPGQREVLAVVRPMVEAGAALAVMGNHEFNALAYHTPDPAQPGEYLRPHNARNTRQHQAFLDAYAQDPQALEETLAWFYTLPLWLELDGLRVVHAAWWPEAMALLREQLTPAHQLTESLLVQASRKGTGAHAALETLLKGVEAPLPAGVSFRDKDGHLRQEARLKWWCDARRATWRSIAFVPDAVAAQLPETPLPAAIRTGYAATEPPVFVGHYWLSGEPAPLAENVACLDYSIARPGGKLVAYRWDGEDVLQREKWIAVGRSAASHRRPRCAP